MSKSVDEAYRQLLQYREALESPPLLIVSDIGRIEIHTNFTGTKKEVHTIKLGDLDQPESLALLRRVFTEPESFRLTVTSEKITQSVAAQLGAVAEGLRSRGQDPHDTAHFLMKRMFCLFAEDDQSLQRASDVAAAGGQPAGSGGAGGVCGDRSEGRLGCRVGGGVHRHRGGSAASSGPCPHHAARGDRAADSRESASPESWAGGRGIGMSSGIGAGVGGEFGIVTQSGSHGGRRPDHMA